MIYGRFGEEITCVRHATRGEVVADLGQLTKAEEECYAAGAYLWVEYRDRRIKSRVVLQAYLRADGGSLEISEALRTTAVPQ